EDRRVRHPAVLRGVERPLDRIDPRRGQDPPPEELVVGAVRRWERRPSIEDEVDLGDDAGRPVVAGPPTQGRADRDGIRELEEGPFRIQPGHDDRGRDLLTRGEGDAGDAVVARRDRGDARATADLGTRRPSRRSERLGQRPRPADREDRLPRRSAVVAGRVAEEDGRGARGPRAEERVADAPPGDRRANGIGLERLGDEVGNRHRQDPQARVGVVLAKPPERSPELQSGQGVAQIWGLDVGWRPCRELRQEAGERSNQAVEVGIAVRVAGRPRAEPIDRSGLVDPERDGAAVGLRGEDPDLRRHEPQAVRAEVEVLDDRRSEAPDRVREAWHPNAAELRGLGGPADAIARLEHERPPAGPGEVGRGDEGVVPAADHDGVELGRHRQAALRPSERSTSRAAIRPFAPMIPPPGWVDEPHSHRSLIGVRNRAQPGTGRLKKSCSSESSPWKMLPSVRPVVRSMSSGVMTWRWRIFDGRSGANSAIRLTTASPNASRWRSQPAGPPRDSSSWYGAYWTKQLMTCLPGGAIDGSTRVGMTMSMYGFALKRPYFASS